jgi:hypothetical protein
MMDGNMVASLKRGNGSFTLANEKRFDAWGQVSVRLAHRFLPWRKVAENLHHEH